MITNFKSNKHFSVHYVPKHSFISVDSLASSTKTLQFQLTPNLALNAFVFIQILHPVTDLLHSHFTHIVKLNISFSFLVFGANVQWLTTVSLYYILFHSYAVYSCIWLIVYFTYSDFIWIQEVWMDGNFSCWFPLLMTNLCVTQHLCIWQTLVISCSILFFWTKSNMSGVWDQIDLCLCCIHILIYMLISCKAVVSWMFQGVSYTCIGLSLCVLQFSLRSNEDKSVSPVILIFQSIYTWLLYFRMEE